MKKSLRFASAALALTLAAGCAMPAFAAGKSSFSKSETVYAVMNGDGSIKSTTVSEHLYSASGLANVTLLDNLALELGRAHKRAPPLLAVEIPRARQLLDGAAHGDASHAVILRELHLGRNARAGCVHATRDLAL